jgi:Zn-dependent alcohol dehydrogenase
MGLDVVVEEVELDDLGDYDVRLKVMTCTICHSDIHALTGEHGEYDGPGSAGHEIAGIVEEIGPKVTYVKPGDRVICSEVRAGCGSCPQCLKGHQWFCENMVPLTFRLPSAFTRLNGERVIQTCSGTNGFAEYTNAHEDMLCKLDDDIPYQIGSALACGFMSGFGAVLNRSKITPGESFAVIGCGGVGLSGIMGAKLSGAIPIIAIDTMDSKLEAAVKFGATHTINPTKVDTVEEVKKLTGGYGVDHSLIAVAGRPIKRIAMDITADYGKVVIVGHEHPKNEMLSDICALELLSGKMITGSVMGAITYRKDIPIYMDMYRKGYVDIDALLTKRFTLDQIKEALDDSLTGSLKNVVVIGGEGL